MLSVNCWVCDVAIASYSIHAIAEDNIDFCSSECFDQYMDCKRSEEE